MRHLLIVRKKFNFVNFQNGTFSYRGKNQIFPFQTLDLHIDFCFDKLKLTGPAFLLEVLTPVCLLVAFCSSLNMGLNLVDPR